eukprot:CAMPEP_0206320538 /NCGR_PEP_ID=MMETSP0106_2-20121207/18381_1 /ASSEMBLY_ACC=CAM_ASM_000206 /TAXON_ID=81532 /ORGANISM="Acanthoeca-like sp., Strain 10tr" /LENGTH=32 /DNA_ID= /DNA_START= /DNA_END= /DNA_ORIENTATION=
MIPIRRACPGADRRSFETFPATRRASAAPKTA